jgi:hypothetical protein
MWTCESGELTGSRNGNIDRSMQSSEDDTYLFKLKNGLTDREDAPEGVERGIAPPVIRCKDASPLQSHQNMEMN